MAAFPTSPSKAKPCGRIPVIMQMEALECGAVSLSMICAYYGLWLAPEKVREDCGVGRDGANAGNIARAARRYGLTAQGRRTTPEKLEAEGSFPCIIHWGFNHFVVLRGFKKGKALINDPAHGEIAVSADEFDRKFTGVLIDFAPGPEFRPAGERPSIAGFLKKRLIGSADGLIYATITTALLGVFTLVTPLLSQVVADKLIVPHSTTLSILFHTTLTLLIILQTLTGYLNAHYLLKTEGKLSAVGSTLFMWHILHLPMDFFSQRSTGDLIDRLGLNKTVANSAVARLAPIVINFITAVVCFVIMLGYSCPLALAGLVATGFKALAARLISNKRTNFVRVQMRDAAKLSSETITGIQTIETLKASGAVDGFLRRWTGYQASANLQIVGFAKLNSTWGLIPQAIASVLDAIVLIAGIWLVINGQFTTGMVVAFQGVLAQFSAPLESLIQSAQTMQETTAHVERIEDVMNYHVDPLALATDLPEDAAKLKGEVELRNVTFGYTKLSRPLIQNINLKVQPGGCIAFVGPSGCGKSTLAKLISGLYRPWEGEVLLDGKPLPEIDHATRCGSIACVDQDIVLFEDTVANNIRLLDDSIEDFDVILAALDADIYDAIIKREGGLDYKLRENGTDFSGGQRQRIEIARALAADPTILILDEATSALDAKTELKVLEAVRERGATIIMVTHRLSAIRDCDEIIVMEQGEIKQRGTHEELMKEGGLYVQLVTKD